jgi:NADPH:quinone reductase-like Zn-dependent oxidoreductase
LPGTTSSADRNFALLSTRRSADQVEVSVREVALPQPIDPDDIVVRMLAAPINPSDIGTMLGPADPATAQRAGDALVLRVPGPSEVDPAVLGVARPLGLEGAGRVVAAGPGRAAQELLGRVVGLMGTGTFARYVRVRARDSVPLGEDTSAAQGAAALINPLTALGMVETMRQEGFTALVHTAAASNLGRMLQRLCLAEGIGLVNVVRRADQAELLRSLGADHVLDSSSPTFSGELVDALHATGATLAFDAVGGGQLAGQILSAMEQAAIRGGAGFPHGPRYGTAVAKKVYLYGSLDLSPVTVDRRFGFTWSIGGWLVFRFLEEIGPERAARLRRRAVDEIATTFASGYTRTIGLSAVTDPETLRAVSRRATGEKYLLDLDEGTDDDRPVR